MFCRNCGNKIDDNTTVCPACGAAQEPYQQNIQSVRYDYGQQPAPYNNQYNGRQPYNNYPPSDDNGGFLWGLLGCCVPIAGLILFLIWKDEKPKTAKAAGIGALVFAGFMLLYIVFIFIIGFIGMSNSYTSAYPYHYGYGHHAASQILSAFIHFM